MKYRAFPAIFTTLFGFIFPVYSQYAPTVDQMRMQEQMRRRQEALDLQRRSRILDNLSQNRTIVRQNFFREKTLSEQERELRKKIVAPAPDDLEISKDFLTQPNTGIFRLFPDNDCLLDGVVRADAACGNTFPGTWFYSFRKKDYSNGLFFDLSLKNGEIFSDGFLALGILAKLGNFSLDRINSESESAKFLANFVPQKKASEIKRQYEDIGKGIKSGEYVYARQAKAELGGVYLLRVIAYNVEKKVLSERSKNNNAGFDGILALKEDERKDITIAFRIIKTSKAGDLTIIWKELDKRKSPEVIFSN